MNCSQHCEGVYFVTEIKFSKNGEAQQDRSTTLYKCKTRNVLFDDLITVTTRLYGKPKLIISINGEVEEKDLISDFQIILKQAITDLIGTNDTWIIGAGLKVGIHKLVGEVIKNIKLLNVKKKICLIGIGSWKNISNSEQILPETTNYRKSDQNCNGKFSLDKNYDVLYFNDIDDDNDQNQPEILFRNNFEKCLEKFEALSIQIVYGGNESNLLFALNCLCDCKIIAVIKGSGGIADLVVFVMELEEFDIYQVNRAVGNLFSEPLEHVKEYLSQMYHDFKNEIIIYDLQDDSSRFDEKLYKSLMLKERNPRKNVLLSLLFKEKIIDKRDFSQNFDLIHFKYVKEVMKIILMQNKESLFQIIFPKIKNEIIIFRKTDLKDLYEKSMLLGIGHKDLINYKWQELEALTSNSQTNKTHQNQKSEDIELINTNQERNSEFIMTKDLFIWSLESDLYGISRSIWENSYDYIAMGLVGSITLNSIADKYEKEGCKQLSHKYLKESKFYQIMLKAIISEEYKRDYEKAVKCILRPLEILEKKSSLQVVMQEELVGFCNQEACQYFLSQAWQMENEYKEKQYNQKVKSGVKWREMICTPKAKYYAHLISYIIFLFLFAYFNLVELDTFSLVKTRALCLEIIIYFYIFGFIIEEVQQILNEVNDKNHSRFYFYFKKWGNKCDVAIGAISVINIICRFSLPDDLLMVIRCCYAIMLSTFLVKMMLFYLYNSSIGHKVIMIKKMMKDILFFLAIFIIYILAYGTLLQSLQYPNSKFDLSLLKDIFFRPYFQVYGELMIDTFSIPEPCNTTNCIIRYSVMVIGFAIFLLFTNILLINLLIAMFNFTFQQDIEDRYSFLCIQLLHEYHCKTILPPPFNFISLVISTIRYFSFKSKSSEHNYSSTTSILVKHFSKNEMNELYAFEDLCKKIVLKKKNSILLEKDEYGDNTE